MASSERDRNRDENGGQTESAGEKVVEKAQQVGDRVQEVAERAQEVAGRAGRAVGRDGGARRSLEQLVEGLILASEGSGPLLQRDYWGVISNCTLTAAEVAERVADDFCAFAPEALVRFDRVDRAEGPLEVGDELEVQIRLAGVCRVRVTHRGESSITLATLRGHPEAGRITFGAYPNAAGDIVFHIRSRARSSDGIRYAGFLTAGEPMQTTTWTDFIDRLAHTVGDGIVGVIHADTEEIEDEDPTPDVTCSPTFDAIADPEDAGGARGATEVRRRGEPEAA